MAVWQKWTEINQIIFCTVMYTHNETLKEGGRKILMMCGVYSSFRWPNEKSKRNMKPASKWKYTSTSSFQVKGMISLEIIEMKDFIWKLKIIVWILITAYREGLNYCMWVDRNLLGLYIYININNECEVNFCVSAKQPVLWVYTVFIIVFSFTWVGWCVWVYFMGMRATESLQKKRICLWVIRWIIVLLLSVRESSLPCPPKVWVGIKASWQLQSSRCWMWEQALQLLAETPHPPFPSILRLKTSLEASRFSSALYWLLQPEASLL